VVGRQSVSLCVRSGDIYPERLQQPAGVAWILQVSLSNIVQNLILKRQVGDQLLQPNVLLLQLLQLPSLLDVQTSVFLSVPVVALLSQTCFLAGCGNALAVALQHLNLPQLRNDLLGSQPFLRHRFSPFQAIFSQFARFRKCRSGHFPLPVRIGSRCPGGIFRPVLEWALPQ
jgi:hypothetical protein